MKARLPLALILLALLETLSTRQAALAQEPNREELFKKAMMLIDAGKPAEAEEPLNSLLAQAHPSVGSHY